MLFNSYVFILFFLPITLLGYFGLYRLKNTVYSKIFLLGMSLWFYAYFNTWYLFIILFSILFNFIFSKILCNVQLSAVGRKLVMVAAIAMNVAVIFYYKYYDFFIGNINSCFKVDFQLKNLVLPLGISFFTFQQISYIVDSYYYATKDYTLLDYALFVTFFPQLIAGPIVLHNELIPQFKDEKSFKVNWDNLACGLYVFVMGLSKKVLIADTFGRVVDWGYSTDLTLTSMEIFVISISYTLQIYFDFSGYCDMAIGIAKMLNIDIPKNFNSPYKATSILEFWDRWHMTLTRFLRQYIYFPLGGSKKGKVRSYINIMIVFLVSGIWHGANWTFILWGILHGIADVLTRMLKRTWEKMHIVTRWIITFMFVNVTWIIFRAESVSQAFVFIRRLFGCENWNVRTELTGIFKGHEILFLEKWVNFPVLDKYVPPFYMLLYIVLGLFVCLNCANNQEIKFKATRGKLLTTIVLLVWCVFSLSGISTFLYFNF